MDIQSFNEQLVKSDSRYDLIDYIHKINSMHKDP